MDVHPPHEPIRSWQDFLLHLLTITIGLLIALALEGAVEAIHFHNLVSDTRRNLAREIYANHDLFAENLHALEGARTLLTNDIVQLRALRAGTAPETLNLKWSFAWSSFDDSAWKSARDSGAMTHMDPKVIEVYAGIYTQQDYVNQGGVGILLDEAKAAAPLRIAQDHRNPRELLPSEIEMMLLACAELDARAETLQAIMQSLEQGYAAVLRAP